MTQPQIVDLVYADAKRLLREAQRMLDMDVAPGAFDTELFWSALNAAWALLNAVA